MFGFAREDMENIRTVAHEKAHQKQKPTESWFARIGAGAIGMRTVYDAEYRDWALLAVLSDIALSLRTLAAPPEPPKKQGS